MYKSYVEGKRVCLVAPGSQTEIMKIGPLIDSYDIVARVGMYNYLVPEELGSRTDIRMDNFWCWCDKYTVDQKAMYDMMVSEGTKWVRQPWCNTIGLDNFRAMNQDRIAVSQQNNEIFLETRKHMRSPTKGICSVFDLLAFPIKELFLVGFSFGKGFSYRKDAFENPFNMPPCVESGYVDTEWSVNNLDKWSMTDPDHNIKEEFDCFKSIKDDRMKCDEWLERILKCN